MKVEHKLSLATTAYVARALEQLNTLREQYLSALGRAKEIEMQSVLCRQALQQHLAIIEQTEGLPPSLTPYALNAEGTALIGETADLPPAEAASTITASRVNGALEVQHG